MASSSNSIHHIRSNSLPCRSHPATLQFEGELQNLKTWEASTSATPSAETICSGLSALERLYRCVNEILSLPLTQQALSKKLVDELLDRSMFLLDVCGSTRDGTSQVKEYLREVQLAQRRGNGEKSIDISFIKKMKKDARRAISALKKIDNKVGSTTLLDLDHHLSMVIKSLRDACAVTVSVLESLLSFITLSVSKPKSTRWSMVSKLIHKGTIEAEHQPKCLESDIEVMENSLECMFRSLIKTRASLLNIHSY